MRRLIAPVAAAWLVLVLVLSAAPAVLADERDPRCDAWEQVGPPPGIDMAASCPSTSEAGTRAGTEEVDLDSEPLVPCIAGLLVMATVLTVFGFIAIRVTARPRRDPKGRAWWTCAACGSPNQPRRTACFACQASRAEPTATHPA